ncbi:MAG: DnaJ protein [Frankiales bacterium]|nr:DnaJ protein [Frankiales bacterium]
MLGLEPGADVEVVRQAHRRLVKALHPDRGGSRVLFEQVQTAYEDLTDVAAPVARPDPQADPPVVPMRKGLLLELRGKPKEQWVVEGLLAAQLSIGGVGLLAVVLR